MYEHFKTWIAFSFEAKMSGTVASSLRSLWTTLNYTDLDTIWKSLKYNFVDFGKKEGSINVLIILNFGQFEEAAFRA